MVKVVGVRFKHAGKIYYFDPVDIELMMDDAVVVETARGVEYGEVVVPPKNVSETDVVQPLKQVLRRATEADMQKMRENADKEKVAYNIGLEKIEKHGLPMKLVDVEYTFDESKVIFYFTADGRVDFRDLVKDLASVFRTRIELRQIGVRDQAKMLGGLGPCGRSLCCATFLGDFEPVSIKMAKEQNLSLNPSKISGICGRLMCCLKFETEMYKAGQEPASLGNADIKGDNACGCACDVCAKGDSKEAGGSTQEQTIPDSSSGSVAQPRPEKAAEANTPTGDQGSRKRKRRYRRPRNRPKKQQQQQQPKDS
ncbi:MAG: stage 0 sporulation family protein [Firmicutes bacterium]|nr:stage 0 sporulation family protein [Bacillota bacterium]